MQPFFTLASCACLVYMLLTSLEEFCCINAIPFSSLSLTYYLSHRLAYSQSFLSLQLITIITHIPYPWLFALSRLVPGFEDAVSHTLWIKSSCFKLNFDRWDTYRVLQFTCNVPLVLWSCIIELLLFYAKILGAHHFLIAVLKLGSQTA